MIGRLSGGYFKLVDGNVSKVLTAIPDYAVRLIEGLWNVALELNAVLGLQGWLIVLTLAVTGMSYRSQKRAGIREAIEQLDPRHVQYRRLYGNGQSMPIDVQLKAGLNRFGFIRRQSEIAFFSNELSDPKDRVVSHSLPPYHLTTPLRGSDEYHSLEERILAHELVDSVDRDETQLYVTCSSVNPVECRQVAAYVLDRHDESARNQIHDSDYWPFK